MSARVRVWVEVASRAALDAARDAGVADTFLVPAGAPLYGRPGDRLAVAVTEADLRGRAGALASRLPVRAGVLVPASAEGLAFLGEMRGRGRSPLAVAVTTTAEARRAVEAGATDVVAPDALVARSIRDAAGDDGYGNRVRATSVAAAQESLAASVDGLLIPDGSVASLMESPSLGPSLAPRPAAVRTGRPGLPARRSRHARQRSARPSIGRPACTPDRRRSSTSLRATG